MVSVELVFEWTNPGSGFLVALLAARRWIPPELGSDPSSPTKATSDAEFRSARQPSWMEPKCPELGIRCPPWVCFLICEDLLTFHVACVVKPRVRISDVVAQLVERSLSAPEIHSWNPYMDKILSTICIFFRKGETKETKAGNGPS